MSACCVPGRKCFDALFRRYYKPLCTYATRFVAPARAEELVQDTLMWVWENRTSLLPEMPSSRCCSPSSRTSRSTICRAIRSKTA
ncbi:MAG: hypothetical protein ACLRMJ_08610 [Alistipes finegoldii]